MHGSTGRHGNHDAHVGGDLHVEYLLLAVLPPVILPVGILIVIGFLLLPSGPSRLCGSRAGSLTDGSSKIIRRS